MKPSSYVPRRGDAVWLTLDPHVGHEQAGRRPVVVLTPEIYNAKTGLALVCPVTSRVKGYAFEVPFPTGSRLKGAVLANQARSVDWRGRDVEYFGPVAAAVLADVVAKIQSLIA